MLILAIAVVLVLSFFAVVSGWRCITAMTDKAERGRCQKCGSHRVYVYYRLEVNVNTYVALHFDEKRLRCRQCGHNQLLKRVCSSTRRRKVLK